MRDPAFPIFCALGAFLCILPLPWHWQARNTGTLIYVGWTFTGCIIFLVNAVVWAGNTNDSAPVFCDISSRFVIALSVGLPASSLCVQRRLYRVAAMKEVSIMKDTKKRELIIDLSIGVALPLLVIVLYYVVQPMRYIIIEDIGCWPGTLNLALDFPMIRMWPVLVSTASFIYAGLTIRAFLQTRRQFSRVLSESGAGLNMSRFFRLMALAMTDMFFSLPLSLYFMIVVLANTEPLPWISWEDTHQQIHEVWTMSYELTISDAANKTSYDLNRWSVPGCAFLFFMFFGLSSEAVMHYKFVFWCLAAPFGFKPSEVASEPQITSWRRRFTNIASTSMQIDIELQSNPHISMNASHPSYSPGNTAAKQPEIDEESKYASTRISDVESQR